MCVMTRKDNYFIIFLFIVAVHLVIIYLFISENNDSYAFSFYARKYSISTVRTFKDKWESIDGEEHAYIFSAYVIPEDFQSNWYSKLKNWYSPKAKFLEPKTIMIVGATSSYNLQFFCQIWYTGKNDSTSIVVTKATMLDLDTNDKMKFQCNLFACPLPDQKTPQAVSLTTDEGTTPARAVTLAKPTKRKTRNFTMCLPALFKATELWHAQRFIEWVELNRILGANHFTVYNHSIGPDMELALRLFEKKGLAEIVQWDLPMEGIYYYAEHAALNDCLLRNRFKSKYIINSDMDEFIIPHGHNVFTWEQMLKQLPEESAYSFKSAFFHMPEDISTTHNKSQNNNILLTLQNLERDKDLNGERVKYMVNSDSAQRIKIHNAYELRWGREVTVDPSIGFIHHYRSDEIKEVIKDTTVYNKYAMQLSPIVDVYKNFFKRQSVKADKKI